MLGVRSDAEDALQDLWIRVSKQDLSAIENLAGWLTTALTRICLDYLRSRARTDAAFVAAPALEGIVIDIEAEMASRQSIGLALSLVLATLDPAERVAFVLHDVFAVPFAEIAVAMKRSPGAVRQLASRGRRRLVSNNAEQLCTASEQLALAERYLAASREGDLPAVVALLDPTATLRIELDSLVSVIQGAHDVACRAVSFRARASQTRLVVFEGALCLARFENGIAREIMILSFKGAAINELKLVTPPTLIVGDVRPDLGLGS